MRKPNTNLKTDSNAEPTANEFVTRAILARRWITSISTLKRLEKDPDPKQRLEPHRPTKRAVRYLMSDIRRLESGGEGTTL